MSDVVTEFLAKHGVTQPPLEHSGVKGMRWGVRKDDRGGSGRTVSRVLASQRAKKRGVSEVAGMSGLSRKTAKQLDAKLIGSTVTVRNPINGEFTTIIKQHGGSWRKIDLSPDAQILGVARVKSPHEMSNDELRQAVNRQKILKEYQDLFSPPKVASQQGKSKLELEIDRLQLQKKYADARQALIPPKQKSVLTRFLNDAESKFKTFQNIDKATGGLISKKISEATGIGVKQPSFIDQVKNRNDVLRAEQDNLKMQKKIKEMLDEDKDLYVQVSD